MARRNGTLRRADSSVQARLVRLVRLLRSALVAWQLRRRRAGGEAVSELRVDWGPGYRVYFARVGKTILLLLCGADKRTQRDIANAKAYFQDYKHRTEKVRIGKRAT
jgi:putative addiction module killer protein